MIKKPICGKVARVLNSRELALNIGEDHGVHIGMKFDVMDETGKNITDPDTNQIIGSIERAKVRVEIIDVQKNLSVASTYRTHNIDRGGRVSSLPQISQILLPNKWVQKMETLKADETTWEDISENESHIKKGDKVIQVISNENENLSGERPREIVNKTGS